MDHNYKLVHNDRWERIEMLTNKKKKKYVKILMQLPYNVM